jgi:ABC-2 type transport system permease protein
VGGVRTMVWKELREQYLRGGHPAFAFWAGVFLDFALGIGIPIFLASITMEGDLATRFLPGVIGAGIVAIAFQATLAPLAVVVDAIAGERERHTLETLLASPLSDSAILWGKVLSMYIVAWAHAAIFGLVFGTTVTVLVGPAGLAAAFLVPVIGGLVGTVTASFFIAIGVLISLRAANVKQGQQWFSYILLPLFLFLPIAGPFGLTGWFLESSPDERLAGFLIGAGLLLLLDLLLMGWARWAFHRERLVAR